MNIEARLARVVDDIDELLKFDGEAFDAPRVNAMKLARATFRTLHREMKTAREKIYTAPRIEGDPSF